MHQLRAELTPESLNYRYAEANKGLQRGQVRTVVEVLSLGVYEVSSAMTLVALIPCLSIAVQTCTPKSLSRYSKPLKMLATTPRGKIKPDKRRSQLSSSRTALAACRLWGRRCLCSVKHPSFEASQDPSQWSVDVNLKAVRYNSRFVAQEAGFYELEIEEPKRA